MRDLTAQYRPNDWANIIGQGSLVKVLQNEIASDSIGHAYLFTGTRGSGKTSTARVFAKHIDAVIVEMDAASNNGVESIRDLKEDVQYLPTNGKKYKVYIIDEVHMLSTSAFNAFLKLLEEPPAYVIFVLATTDPQKIPVTILSRCQRFDLKRITVEDIIARLNFIACSEQIVVTYDALEYIAKSVDGGLRDAIKLLQKCSSLDTEITLSTVIDALGVVDKNVLEAITSALLARDSQTALSKYHELLDKGTDIRVCLTNLAEFLIDMATSNVINNTKDDVDAQVTIAEALLQLLYQNRNVTMLKISSDLKFIRICTDSIQNGSKSCKNIESTNNVQAVESKVQVFTETQVDNDFVKFATERMDATDKRITMLAVSFGKKV